MAAAIEACDTCVSVPSQSNVPASPVVRGAGAQLPRLSSSTTAFELVASSEGALLSWAVGPCEKGIAVQRYDADGESVGKPTLIDGCGPVRASRAEVVQLSAVADGGKLALAWIVQAGVEGHVLGSFGSDTANAFAPTMQLGAAFVDSAKSQLGRGRLTMAGAEGGRMRVAWRAPAGPCNSGQGQCARVFESSYPPATAMAGVADRGADAREIPDPCAALLVGSLWSGGVWYEGLCALEAAVGQPVTEVYAIRPEIFYAEAFPVLNGCSPLGLAPTPRGVLVLGRCDDGLRIHDVTESRQDVLVAAVRDVHCESGRPRLEIHSRQGQSLEYKLGGPTDRIELWLPRRVAPAESRVAFTGRKLLVATVQESQLRLQAWKCHGETLVSDSSTML